MINGRRMSYDHIRMNFNTDITVLCTFVLVILCFYKYFVCAAPLVLVANQ